MVTAAEQAQQLLTIKTADRFRREGYEVSVATPLEFMNGFKADVVARRGDEVRVIQVKSSVALASDRRSIELAELIEQMPGWSFDLVLVPEPERLPAPTGTRPFRIEDVSSRLREATHLLEMYCYEAGLLLAWSALEAVLRLQSATVEAPRDSRVTTAHYALEEATHLGVIYHEEYQRLREIARYRNAILHGFTHDGDAEELASELIATAELLMVRDLFDEDELEADQPSDPIDGYSAAK